jgi:hypothetical protein
MALNVNTSINLGVTSNSDGFSLTGGSTQRSLGLSGANIFISGSGSNTYTFPTISDILVGQGTSITGDASGTVSAFVNTAIRGLVFDPAAISQGDVITYQGTQLQHVAAGGDVTGAVSALAVQKIRGTTFDSTAPTEGEIIVYQGGQFTHVAINGDVTGAATAIKTIALRGLSVNVISPTEGQLITFTNASYKGQTIGGDISGAATAIVTNRLKGLTLNPSLEAATGTSKVLIWDEVNNYLTLSAQSGSSSNMTGTLSGDVTGSTTANIVNSIKSVALNPSLVTTTGASKALIWDEVNNYLTLSAQSGSSSNVTGTLSGDVTGSTTASTVVNLRGLTVNSANPTEGQFITFTNASYRGQTIGGDVSGAASAIAVVNIQGKPVIVSSLSAAGLILTYDGTNIVGSGVPTASVAALDGDITGNTNATTVVHANASVIQLAGTGMSLTSVQDMNNIFHSAGTFATDSIVSASISANTISALPVYLALKNPLATSITSTLNHLYFAGATANIPSNTTRFIGLSSSSANVVTLATKTSDSWNYISEIPIGVVVNEAGTIHIMNDSQTIADHAAKMARYNYETMPFSRDNRNGGLIISDSADTTRKFIMTAGAIWDRLNRYAIAAVNSSTTAFVSYYRNGGTGFTRVTGQTQWDNTKYDNNTGTLATLAGNRFANLWFYVETEGDVYCIYGRGNYTSAALALAETTPATLPDTVSYHATLLGRFIIQGNVTNAIQVQSAFSTTFNGATVSTVSMAGDLSGNNSTSVVIGIQNTPLLTDALVGGDIMYYNGTNWAHDSQAGDVSGSITATVVNKIKGVTVDPNLASSTGSSYVMTWDSANNRMTFAAAPAGAMDVLQVQVFS